MNRRIETLKLEVNKAKALMSEADILFQNKAYFGVVHLLYYGCFHATKDLVTKTHSGVFTLLNQHFVKPGLVEEAKAAFFKKLMNERVESDYGISVSMDENEIKDFMGYAKEYFNYVLKLVESYNAE